MPLSDKQWDELFSEIEGEAANNDPLPPSAHAPQWLVWVCAFVIGFILSSTILGVIAWALGHYFPHKFI